MKKKQVIICLLVCVFAVGSALATGYAIVDSVCAMAQADKCAASATITYDSSPGVDEEAMAEYGEIWAVVARFDATGVLTGSSDDHCPSKHPPCI